MFEAHNGHPERERPNTNYRPISSLNVDIKTFSKILANRLLPILPTIISQDQVGFKPGHEARDKTIKAINLHYIMTQTNQKRLLPISGCREGI